MNIVLCAADAELEALALRAVPAIMPAADAVTVELARYRGDAIFVTPTARRERRGVAAVLRALSCDVYALPADFDPARDDPTTADCLPMFQQPKSEGARLLDDVLAFLRRFVVYPSPDAAIAHALWIAHAHLMEAWESTPRIAFLSPEPSSGKTRALEITETLVPRPVESVNATAAYLFRKVSDPEGMPTILYDEIDTIFGPKAKENEDVRGLPQRRASSRRHGGPLRRARQGHRDRGAASVLRRRARRAGRVA